MNSTFLRVTHNYFSRFYKFKKDVCWPGLVKVDIWGEIEIILEKKEKGIWKGFQPVEISYEGLRKVVLPDFYHTKVLEVKNVGQAGILTLQIEPPVYSHIYPGKLLMVKQTFNGKEVLSNYLYLPVGVYFLKSFLNFATFFLGGGGDIIYFICPLTLTF